MARDSSAAMSSHHASRARMTSQNLLSDKLEAGLELQEQLKRSYAPEGDKERKSDKVNGILEDYAAVLDALQHRAKMRSSGGEVEDGMQRKRKKGERHSNLEESVTDQRSAKKSRRKSDVGGTLQDEFMVGVKEEVKIRSRDKKREKREKVKEAAKFLQESQKNIKSSPAYEAEEIGLIKVPKNGSIRIPLETTSCPGGNMPDGLLDGPKRKNAKTSSHSKDQSLSEDFEETMSARAASHKAKRDKKYKELKNSEKVADTILDCNLSPSTKNREALLRTITNSSYRQGSSLGQTPAIVPASIPKCSANSIGNTSVSLKEKELGVQTSEETKIIPPIQPVRLAMSKASRSMEELTRSSTPRGQAVQTGEVLSQAISSIARNASTKMETLFGYTDTPARPKSSKTVGTSPKHSVTTGGSPIRKEGRKKKSAISKEHLENVDDSWEVDSGKIRGRVTFTLEGDDMEAQENIAFSSSYIALHPMGIRISNTSFKIHTLRQSISSPPSLYLGGGDEKKLQICSVAEGRVCVRLGGKNFGVGPGGMWRIRSGETCAVSNKRAWGDGASTVYVFSVD